jgi:ribonuclease HI
VLSGVKELMRASNTPSIPIPCIRNYQTRTDEFTVQRLSTVRSLVSYARDKAEEISPMENIKSDDWVEYDNSNFTTGAFGSREWRDRVGEVNNAVVGEMLETKAPSIIIATDGSVRENTTAWGGVIWRDGRAVFEWSTGRHGRSSSYRSECEAMEDAFTWLSINSTANDHVVILADSLSLVSKLQSDRV